MRLVTKLAAAIALCLAWVCATSTASHAAPAASYWQDIRTKTPNYGVALTIDDGPSMSYTPKVLDVLKQHGVKGGLQSYDYVVKMVIQYLRQINAPDETE